jgi:parvulin-like peptidyl-prolyl isomerase
MELQDLVVAPSPKGAVAPLQVAQQALAALRAGEAPESVIARFGLRDARSTSGEEFYFAAKLHLSAPLFAAAVRLPGGAVSEPVVDAAGAHLLRMIRKSPPVAQQFDEVRDRVVADYRRAEMERVMHATERYLTDRADLLIAEDMK